MAPIATPSENAGLIQRKLDTPRGMVGGRGYARWSELAGAQPPFSWCAVGENNLQLRANILCFVLTTLRHRPPEVRATAFSLLVFTESMRQSGFFLKKKPPSI
jgi:hypothetical protein